MDGNNIYLHGCKLISLCIFPFFKIIISVGYFYFCSRETWGKLQVGWELSAGRKFRNPIGLVRNFRKVSLGVSGQEKN